MTLAHGSERAMAAAASRAPKLGRVLVGVDFREESLDAARFVARAFAPGAEVVLAHALHFPEPPRFLAPVLPPTDDVIELARSGAERKLRELGGAIATGLVWPEVRVGAPDEVLARLAAEYEVDVVAVGQRVERSGIRDRLGNLSERVLRRTRLPLLLAAPASGVAILRVLAAIDGSAATGPVLKWTELLMERHGASATLVHVVSPLSPLGYDPNVPSPAHGRTPSPDEPARKREAADWLEGQRRTMRDAERVATLVRVGRAETQIVAEAASGRYDVVVTGTHGRGALGRIAFGSVSEAVLRDAPCPVLVVGPDGSAAPGPPGELPPPGEVRG